MQTTCLQVSGDGETTVAAGGLRTHSATRTFATCQRRPGPAETSSNTVNRRMPPVCSELLEKLPSIEDRGQTDRVTALQRPYALDVDL